METTHKNIKMQLELGNLAFVGDVEPTVANLGRIKNQDGDTALHLAIRSGQLEIVSGPVFAADLVLIKGENQFSALNCIAAKGGLKHICGGVRFDTLSKDKATGGRSAFENAVLADDLGFINDLTPAKLAAVDWEKIFWAAVDSHNVVGMKNVVELGGQSALFEVYLNCLAATLAGVADMPFNDDDDESRPVYLECEGATKAMWSHPNQLLKFSMQMAQAIDWDGNIRFPSALLAFWH